MPTATAATADGAAGCSGVESDFNGDGIRDTAIGDPEATIGTVPRAGKVTIVYGGGKGTLELVQGVGGVPGASEAGDQYGFALAVYDADLDGCADLAVGSPYEDLSTVVDAGWIHIVYGSPSGLNAGKAVKEHSQAAGSTISGATEPGDWLGYALTAGKTAAGEPFLIAGVPGESIGTNEDAGLAVYIHGVAQKVVSISQDTAIGAEVPGVVEPDDRFGASLASTPNHFAIGAPGESIGSAPFAGGGAVFTHTQVSGYPQPLLGLGQDQAIIAGVEEPGDGFATALAMVPYRHNGATSTTESLLAVGVPGEDLSTTLDAGAVQVFRITTAGTLSETMWVDQNSADVEEESEAGDLFGQRLVAINTTPNATSSATTSRLAIGVPGEETGDDARDTGGVHIIPLIGAAGASDAWIAPGAGIPGEPATGQMAGFGIGASTGGLHVGMPYGPSGSHAVHTFSWNVTTGGSPIQTLKPGQGGIPAGDTAFGSVVR
ncbi:MULTISPECIES: FG-GAP repeat domain-containing protein [unclassified Streptomyces]|uniref:FG-GAP repeat domain-containing protein n=1 Tax=unclassified Streptomyces TaxID=2593676 RepID=UPI0016609E50|nr:MULTISPECIES: VCBS repeat-containing protein [unclassified Streptomyces]MBD0711926.1 esterase [Streptomyces sp. CBMA291]MBD0713313.1 esterase [Streptomyces sp. CBMA370]